MRYTPADRALARIVEGYAELFLDTRHLRS